IKHEGNIKGKTERKKNKEKLSFLLIVFKMIG
ncbi:MAG: hypothetical protein RIR96_1174, partial [Bacteroidota bacterium]